VENALAAAACARLLGVPSSAVAKALREFPGVEHRLEFVREVRGVRFVNDSKGTNVDSTVIALKAFPQGGVHLILGGEDKGAPYLPLIPLIKTRVKAVYVIGEAEPQIRRDLGKALSLVKAGTLEKALDQAFRAAVPGDTILLSPACASFDQFNNFEHRGRVFKELVKAL
jgi:UDP-N-acetylmuramoylalanine--D-glutamate ligase